MQERQVTLADTTFPLDDPFWVLATQNPVEQEGVYPLPEAQLDRFSMMLRVGYPSAARRSRDAARADARRRAVDPARLARRRHAAPRPHPRRRSTSTTRSSTTSSGSAARPAHPGEVGRGDLAELLVLGISPRSYQHVLALARVTAFIARAHLRAAGRREGDLRRRGPPPHRAQRPRAGGEHRRRSHPRRNSSTAVPIP